MTGFAGFACSFGGKWFGGYARSKNEPNKNYAKYSKNSLLKKISRMGDVEYYCSSYKNISNKNLLGSVVYCDPPYEGTTSYSNSKEFDHLKFWQWVRKSQKLSDIIFVSEYNSPSDFVCIWKKEQKTKVDSRNIENMFSNIDKLFIHESKLEYYNKVIGE